MLILQFGTIHAPVFSALGVHVCYLGHLGGYYESSDWVPFESDTHSLLGMPNPPHLKQHLLYLAASVFYFLVGFCSKERKGQKKKTNTQLLMKHSQEESTCIISFKKMSIPTHLNKKNNLMFYLLNT